MKIYPENYNVTVKVLFTDFNGQSVTPTEVRAALYDEEDREVVDFGSLPFDAEDGSKDIVIPAAFNVLGDGQTEGARILRVELVTENGTIRRSHSYILQGEFRLVIMTNTFMSLEAAEILARDMPDLMGWAGADEETKQASLINAFNKLTRIPMKFVNDPQKMQERNERWGYGNWGHTMPPYHHPYHWTKDITGQVGPVETIIPAAAWPHVTADEFHDFPAHFRKALRSAQLVEASETLDSEKETVKRKHQQGVISETIGESSVMLRGGQITTGVSRRALEYLTGHIAYSFSVSRA